MSMRQFAVCMPRVTSWSAGLVMIVFVCGCSSYVTPGRGADMNLLGANREAQTDASIAEALAKRPLASFPASIAVARVQAPGYGSQTAQSWGTGSYSIVITHDIEKDEQLAHLAKMPMVQGVAMMNRTLLPSTLNSDYELRHAAAMLHADMLLVYTIDTAFYVKDMAEPLSVITLGLSPNQQARVVTTASAVLMDTRNGYVYGVCDATEMRNQLASAWTSTSAVDDARRAAESAAFDKLVDKLDVTWRGVVAQYASSATTQPAAAAATP
jgi:hypothetical protein